MKRYIISVYFVLFFQLLIFGQPAGYYDSAEGKSGVELQQALHDIIDNHTVISYSGLWTAFFSTDARSDGTVWDMYSDIPDGPNPYDYTFGSDQCGNYSGEGSCYNREHSFPKSWFNDASPMYSDLFHLYPTDGYVNGIRGNYPFGETSNPTKTSLNGSKLGPCSVSGYTGTVFEPIDEYKGDFARTYFYMATRYFGEDGSWPGSPMVDGAQPIPWARVMLIQWHNDDPVSEKETDRNEAVFALQKNRNPYIDHPEYVELLYEGGPIDELAPVLDSISVAASDSLVLWFNEELNPESVVSPGYYQMSSGAEVITAGLIPGENSVVGLKVSGLENGSQSIVISGLSDLSGNIMQFAIYSFSVDLLNSHFFSIATPLIYPNPNKGCFDIKMADAGQVIRKMSLFDLTGRSMPFQGEWSGDRYNVSSDLVPGMYECIMLLSDGKKICCRLIIN